MAGIYLHIPFCKQACYYCDFHFSTSLKKKSDLVQALAQELMLRKNEITDSIETIYFGGGTPSLLSKAELSFLLHTIYANFNVSENPEITLEANPDDLNLKKLEALKKIGINRLSIGVQSFFDEDLHGLNRAHTANEAIETLKIATKLFDNITIDLIYGIPKLTKEKWLKNLEIAFDLGVNHISSYALTVEPNTALYQFIKTKKYPNIDDALALQHFKMLQEETFKKGFVQYEVSNFGKPNYFSKHNTSYWLEKSYLGIGPSAHSYQQNKRSWNVSNNTKYIKAINEKRLPIESEKLSLEDRFNEFVMIGLRTIWGISLKKIKTEFGEIFLENLLKNTKKHIKNNHLIIENNTIKATKKGLFFIDGIASDLFIIK